VVWVSWRHSDDSIAAGKNVNVAVATYVMTQARLQLYEYLSELGSLSCTVIQCYLHSKLDETPKVRTGGYLGHLTDELEEFGALFFIEEFVSVGLKNYAFSDPRHDNVKPNVRQRV